MLNKQIHYNKKYIENNITDEGNLLIKKRCILNNSRENHLSQNNFCKL